ncbi:MAG: hypothetical protein JNJ58_06385 [Chitinophagaceae bacterium]|nr:hypothetical protein [Chitinophagaceae bacterium]
MNIPLREARGFLFSITREKLAFLRGWKIKIPRHEVARGKIHLGVDAPLTGISITNPFHREKLAFPRGWKIKIPRHEVARGKVHFGVEASPYRDQCN